MEGILPAAWTRRWILVRKAYPTARLGKIWETTLEFTEGGRTWLAIFDEDQTAIESVFDVTREGLCWAEIAQDQMEERGW